MLLEKVNFILKKIYDVFYSVSHCAIVMTQKYAFSHQNNKNYTVTRTACQKKSKLLIFRYNMEIFLTTKKCLLVIMPLPPAKYMADLCQKTNFFFF